MNMLDRNLWTTFDKELSEPDVEKIEHRLAFLRDILEDAARQYDVEDVRSDLDLNLHIYLKYFELSKDAALSAWVIHDAWFKYYQDGADASAQIKALLKPAFVASHPNLRAEIADYLRCLDAGAAVACEADAVAWLSFLDYLAAKLIHQIARNRFQEFFLPG